MPKTKISEYSATANSNTDVASINIDEGCAPSGINNAIRAVMGHLKDFQAGTNGDSFNGPVGTGTAAAVAATTLTTSSTVTHNGGTANGVGYLNGSKALTTGSALVFDGTNLGVGASSPASKLQVTSANGAVTLDSGTGESHYIDINHKGSYSSLNGIRFKQNSTTYGNNQIDFLAMDSGGTVQTVMTLNGAGNLGLGVTPSAWTNTYQAFQIGNLGNSLVGYKSAPILRLDNNSYISGGVSTYAVTGYGATSFFQYNGAFTWSTAASGTAGNTISFTQAMTLDVSGNLGVGTSSPSSKLDVVSSGDAARFGNTKKLYISTDSSGYGLFSAAGQTGTGLYVSDTSSFMYFATGSSERARIDSSGNLLVGTTTANGDGVTVNIRASAGSTTSYLNFNRANTASQGTVLNFQNNSSVVGSIYHTNTATTYATSSDYRLKDITGPVIGAKEFIMALQPKQGTWKTDGSVFVGFIAHEFQEVSPSSVSGEKDAVDENGNPIMQAMQASSPEVMANLVALLQEQQTIITSLTARITALEA